MGSSFSLRSTVECRRSGRGVSPFTSHLGAIELSCFGWLLFWGGACFCCLLFVFGSLHLGFLHGFRLGPIGLLPVYHRRLYDRQSLERARHELKKMVFLWWCGGIFVVV